MKQYVLGFLFNEIGTSVVLIRKNKPAWQKGLLNGVGGSIEANESPIEAMHREFWEEAGAACSWCHFSTMSGEGWEVFCFKAHNNIAFESAKTQTAESIEKVLIAELCCKKVVSNLHWLIQLALDENHGSPIFTEIKYSPRSTQ